MIIQYLKVIQFTLMVLTKTSTKQSKIKIAGTSCVLILAGVYSTYSKWIYKEIEISKAFGKPIIAIEPWGAEKTSTIVKNNADIIVKWQGASIVKAIKELG